MDYCNSILLGLPNTHLPSFLNVPARLIFDCYWMTMSRYSSRISFTGFVYLQVMPVHLPSLEWLPWLHLHTGCHVQLFSKMANFCGRSPSYINAILCTADALPDNVGSEFYCFITTESKDSLKNRTCLRSNTSDLCVPFILTLLTMLRCSKVSIIKQVK